MWAARRRKLRFRPHPRLTRPRAHSAKGLLGQGLTRPRAYSAKGLLGQGLTRPRAYSAEAATAAGRSWVRTERPVWSTAAMMAPTIGAKTYSHASPRLPVT